MVHEQIISDLGLPFGVARVEGDEGSDAFLSGETHVYWIGTDGRLRISTIKPYAYLNWNNPLFGKFSDTSTVFMLRDGNRYTVVDESTYFSWRDSFDGLISLDGVNESLYVDAGQAP